MYERLGTDRANRRRRSTWPAGVTVSPALGRAVVTAALASLIPVAELVRPSTPRGGDGLATRFCVAHRLGPRARRVGSAVGRLAQGPDLGESTEAAASDGRALRVRPG